MPRWFDTLVIDSVVDAYLALWNVI